MPASTTNTLDHSGTYPDSRESARVIVPIVLDLIGAIDSVVDLGGGVGGWCRVFKDHGVSRILCIDDARIAARDLMVGPEEFFGCDLSKGMPDPIPCALAVSLEFAEHVPAILSRDVVRFLTESAPVVLFSAAIPGQPSQHHINEQPARFWRGLFRERGYSQFDVVRPRIVGKPAVPYWYRQNLQLYATGDWVSRLESKGEHFTEIPEDFELVHETVLRQYRGGTPAPGVRGWLKGFPQALRRSLAARVADESNGQERGE